MGEVNIGLNPYYPWGPDSVVTGLASVDCEQKMWFVDQILKHGNSAAKLARRFSLPRFAVLHWVKTFRRTGILWSKCGRPRILDRQSMITLVGHCNLHGYADTADLRQQIRVGHHATLTRNGREVDFKPDEDEPPSKRSQKRYITWLQTDLAPVAPGVPQMAAP
jgi:transposase